MHNKKIQIIFLNKAVFLNFIRLKKPLYRKYITLDF